MFKNCNALPINYQVMIFQNSTSKILIPHIYSSSHNKSLWCSGTMEIRISRCSKPYDARNNGLNIKLKNTIPERLDSSQHIFHHLWQWKQGQKESGWFCQKDHKCVCKAEPGISTAKFSKKCTRCRSKYYIN
jgi:hypothetical protein